MSTTIEIIIRTIAAFLWIWMFTLLIGKQIISHGAYHLYALSAVLGTIAGNMAFNVAIKWMYFLISLIVLTVIGYVLTLSLLKLGKARKWITGEPTIIIKEGKLLEQNMKKAKVSMDSLMQGLRSKDIFDVKEVEMALLETNGSLSVLKKPEYRNSTKKDLSDYYSKLR